MRKLNIQHAQMAIGFVCMILGFMIAVQFRTTQDIKKTLPYQRVEDMVIRLTQTEKERDALVKEVSDLRSKVDKLAKGDLSGAAKEMETARMESGRTALSGPGVVVTIDDSKRQSKPGDNPNLYLIHDDDLLKVINELRAAGTEAISINGQRLTAMSEIRCAGPTLSVNNVRYSPPYEIRAIGDALTLENALKMRGGVMETLQFWGIQVTINKEEKLIVPAFKGTYHFQHSTIVKEGEKL